jgi:hypothetical protein
MPKKPTIYTGKLAIPMRRRKQAGLGLLVPLQDDAEWEAEYRERWNLSIDHHKIDRSGENFWVRVAVALADAHVPGLSEKRGKPVGRPKTKNSPQERSQREALLRRVEEKRTQRKGLSEIEACRRVWQAIKREEPASHYARKSFGTVREDLRLARQEQRSRNALVSALVGHPPFDLGHPPSFGALAFVRGMLTGDAPSLPENSSENTSQKSD